MTECVEKNENHLLLCFAFSLLLPFQNTTHVTGMISLHRRRHRRRRPQTGKPVPLILVLVQNRLMKYDDDFGWRNRPPSAFACQSKIQPNAPKGSSVWMREWRDEKREKKRADLRVASLSHAPVCHSIYPELICSSHATRQPNKVNRLD